MSAKKRTTTAQRVPGAPRKAVVRPSHAPAVHVACVVVTTREWEREQARLAVGHEHVLVAVCSCRSTPPVRKRIHIHTHIRLMRMAPNAARACVSITSSKRPRPASTCFINSVHEKPWRVALNANV